MIIRFIIEVMGKPSKIVDNTLKEIVKSFSSRHEVRNVDYADPKKVDNSDLFSAFVEFEFKIDNFEQLFLAVLDYGPTVVEVIEPYEITVKNAELQAALSELVSKFHMLSKAMQVLKLENIKLKKELNTTKK